MKHIQIFGIVLLIAILALPLDVFACDDLAVILQILILTITP